MRHPHRHANELATDSVLLVDHTEENYLAKEARVLEVAGGMSGQVILEYSHRCRKPRNLQCEREREAHRRHANTAPGWRRLAVPTRFSHSSDGGSSPSDLPAQR